MVVRGFGIGAATAGPGVLATSVSFSSGVLTGAVATFGAVWGTGGVALSA